MSDGFCETIECETITTQNQCNLAASKLGLPPLSEVHQVGTLKDKRPPGCFLYEPTNKVEFNTDMQDNSEWSDIDSICDCTGIFFI